MKFVNNFVIGTALLTVFILFSACPPGNPGASPEPSATPTPAPTATPLPDLTVRTSDNTDVFDGDNVTPIGFQGVRVLTSPEYRTISLTNNTDGNLTVNSITISGDPDYSLNTIASGLELYAKIPLVLSDEVIPAGENFEFHLDFGPRYAGTRSATVIITHSTDQTLSFTVSGVATPATAAEFADGTLSMHKIWGGYNSSEDEMPSAMVVDSSGNMYFAGNTKTITADNFYYDIFLAKVSAAGALQWQMVYASEFDDRMWDPGQNDESGGSTQSLAIDADGFIYLVGSVGNDSNSSRLALIMKVDPSDGSAEWIKYWFPDTGRLAYTDACDPYAVTVTADSVLVTGMARDNTIGQVGVFVSSFDLDGNHRWSRLVDPSPGYNDRGYCIAVAPNGSLNVGGWYGAANTGFACQFNFSTTDATLTWARGVSLGTGSNLNCIQADASSNLYFSADRRGATTYFSVVKLTVDGSFSAGKTFTGASGDNHATKVVSLIGDSLYVGGRYSYPAMDTASGDALLLKLASSNLAYQWAGIYYTGVGPDTVCEHHLKGIAPYAGGLALYGQVYTGNLNYHRYYGYWYDAPQEGDAVLEDYAPSVSAIDGLSAQIMVNAGLVDGTTNGGSWAAITDTAVEFQDADAKNGDTNGATTDGDVFLMRMDLP